MQAIENSGFSSFYPHLYFNNTHYTNLRTHMNVQLKTQSQAPDPYSQQRESVSHALVQDDQEGKYLMLFKPRLSSPYLDLAVKIT